MRVKRTVTVEIGGNQYRMAADADDRHLRQLADLINHRLDSLGAGSSRATPAQKLAIVALGLADELVESENLRKEMERRARNLVTNAIQRIDAKLAETAELSDLNADD